MDSLWGGGGFGVPSLGRDRSCLRKKPLHRRFMPLVIIARACVVLAEHVILEAFSSLLAVLYIDWIHKFAIVILT